jgi:hypothetical protein
MDLEKLPGRLVIVIGLACWTLWATTVEPYGRLPHEIRLGKLGLVVAGLIMAWDRWVRLDRRSETEQRQREQAREHARAIDPRRPGPGAWSAGTPLPVGTLVDLGPCPACGDGPSAVAPAPAGVVQVRCRRCGLVGTPPELQPAPRG